MLRNVTKREARPKNTTTNTWLLNLKEYKQKPNKQVYYTEGHADSFKKKLMCHQISKARSLKKSQVGQTDLWTFGSLAFQPAVNTGETEQVTAAQCC